MKGTFISMHIQQINIKIIPAKHFIRKEHKTAKLLLIENDQCRPCQVQTLKDFLQGKILSITKYDNLYKKSNRMSESIKTKTYEIVLKTKTMF